MTRPPSWPPSNPLCHDVAPDIELLLHWAAKAVEEQSRWLVYNIARGDYLLPDTVRLPLRDAMETVMQRRT